jgi:hypothetical protein
LILKVRFHPQAWVNDYAIYVDTEGETDFSVDWEGVVPNDDTYESDNLRDYPEVPEWMREWSGPFWCEILNRDELDKT